MVRVLHTFDYIVRQMKKVICETGYRKPLKWLAKITLSELTSVCEPNVELRKQRKTSAHQCVQYPYSRHLLRAFFRSITPESSILSP